MNAMRRVLLASAVALLALSSSSSSVSAQTTIPPGSIGSPCVTASQCSAYAGLKTTCTAGFCGLENTNPAGQIGAACTATSQCTGMYQGSSLYCLYGVCVPVGSADPGNIGKSCTADSQCTGNYLGYSLHCMYNMCTVNAGGGIAPGGGGSATDPTCTSTADCSSTQQCLYGFCIDYVAPSFNCMVNGQSLCSATETCSFGVCLPPMPVVACPTPCNSANGEVCSPATGTCVVTSGASCGNDCVGGQCLSSPFPGFGSQPVCQMGTTQCSETTGPCASGDSCVWGYCTPCGQLCGLSRDLLSALFAAGGAGGDLSSYTLQQASANLTAAIINGVFQATAGSLVQFDASANQNFALSFAAAAGAAVNAAAQVTAGVQLALQSIFAGTPGAQLLLGAGAGLVSGLNVSSGGSLTLSLGSGLASGGGAGVRTLANFSSGLNVQGLLNIVGDSTTFVTFPSSAPSAGSNAGTVQVSGGVNLQGNVGDLKINIAGSTAAGEAFLASVGAATTLATSGAISGAAKARLVVEGLLLMAGQVLEPALELRGLAGSATFQTSSTPGVATFAGNVTFQESGMGGNNVLTINASTSGSLTADGSNVFFKTFNNCPYTATLRLQVAGTAAAAIARGNLTLLNYDVRSYANVGRFQCDILVCGSADDCIRVMNPNVPVVNGGRRRLLATTTSTTSQASFGPTKVTVSSSKSSTTKPSGATSTAAASVNIAALVLAAIVALLSM